MNAVRDFKDARVLVTGGTSGIGAAYVEAFARAGARVLTCGRSADALSDLSSRLAGVDTVTADVTREADRARLVERAQSLGGLDILVNNAGTMEQPDFAAGRVDLAAIERELALNLFSPIALTNELLPLMPRHAGAAVVMVTSGYALLSPRRAPTYAATKAALRNFSIGLRHQLEPLGIRVVEVLPPLVDTPRTASNKRPKITAGRVAAETLRGLKAGASEVPVGQVRLLKVMMRVAPAYAARLVRDT